jgi:hypothetical protein
MAEELMHGGWIRRASDGTEHPGHRGTHLTDTDTDVADGAPSPGATSGSTSTGRRPRWGSAAWQVAGAIAGPAGGRR